MKHFTKTGVPCAYITKDKKRLKQKGQNVYLKNGEEFELELYNPTSNVVLSKIKLNGKYVSKGGIVLNPGQRIFLERYLDDARKFRFETYEVDGASDEVLESIFINGDVVIEFFDEYEIRIWSNPITYGGSFGGPTYTNNSNTSTLGNFNNSFIGGSNTSTFTNTSFQQTTLSGPNIRGEKSKGSLYDSEVTIDGYSSNEGSIETGRIEKGGKSEQSFETVDKLFNQYTCSTSKWKILPESQKMYDNNDLKIYCTNCGKKRKKDSDKFCSACGTKF